MENYREFMNKQEIREFWNSSSENSFLCMPRSTLYHYTSANALCSIIQNQEFWLTKADFMNDKSEIKYASDLFIERLKQSRIPENEKENLIKSFENSVTNGLFNNIFVLSLSANYDSLPMWSYYGKNDGYNIGVSPCFISDFANVELLKEMHYSDEKRTFIEKKVGRCVEIKTKKGVTYGYTVKANYVLYDEKKQVKLFDLFVDEINRLLRKNTNDAIFQIKVLLSDLVKFIPFIKHPSYENEEEYRLLVQIENLKNSKDIYKIQNYRVFKGALIPYITVKLNRPDYFTSITISPFNNSELTELGVNDLANSYPSGLEIKSSNISIRF